jgi:hypothetical protein
VVRPEDLLVAVEIDHIHRLVARMRAGEGNVPAWVPVLGGRIALEQVGFQEAAQRLDNPVAVAHREGAPGQEVGLHVDDDQGVTLHSPSEGFPRCGP